LADGRVVVLNDGYTIAVFPSADWKAVAKYVMKVEQTFEVTETVVYPELRDFLVPPNTEIVRYFAIRVARKRGRVVEEFALEANPNKKAFVVHADGVVRIEFPGETESVA
jgi:hypothetical protein